MSSVGRGLLMIIKNNLNLASKYNDELLNKKHKQNNAQKVNFGAEYLKISDNYFKNLRNKFIIKENNKVAGFVTAAVSVGGLSVGGLGLMYDYFYKQGRRKANADSKHGGKELTPSAVQTEEAKSEAKEELNTQASPDTNFKGISTNKPSFMQQLKDKTKNEDSVSFKKQEKTEKPQAKEEEFGHFEPETEFGKLGLNLAKVSLAVSGTAGFFTGLASKVPLMCVGEVIANLVAFPIINTPIGYAIMNLGLGVLFLGRAYDSDPVHKANYAVLFSKKPMDGLKYLANNTWGCVKDTVDSTKHLGKQMFNLFSSNKQVKDDAKNFFGSKIFRIKSSTVTVGQEINAGGVVTAVKKGLKGNNYGLKLAAMILAVGGAGVATADILKKLGVVKDDKLKKASFRVAETGQVVDNLTGLVTYGLDRCYKGNPVAGIPTVISGVTMMCGAPNADNDLGKGLTWFGLSFFFLFLAVERFSEMCQAIRGRANIKNGFIKDGIKFEKGFIEEATAVARQFEIDFSKFLPKKYLNYLRKLMGEGQCENTFVTIAKMFKSKGKDGKLNMLGKFVKKYEDSIKEDVKMAEGVFRSNATDDDKLNKILCKVPDFLKFLEKELSGPYDPTHNTEWLIKEIKAADFPEEFCNIINRDGGHAELVKSNILANAKNSGKYYKPVLEEMLSNAKTPEYVKEEIRYAFNKKKALLEA